MTYRDVKKFYGVKVDANAIDITLGVTLLITMLKPQYQTAIEIHICGKEAYITL